MCVYIYDVVISITMKYWIIWLRTIFYIHSECQYDLHILCFQHFLLRYSEHILFRSRMIWQHIFSLSSESPWMIYKKKKKHQHLCLLLNKVLVWLFSIIPVLLPSSKAISDNPAQTVTSVCHFQARLLNTRAISNFSLRRKDYQAHFKTLVLLSDPLNS